MISDQLNLFTGGLLMRRTLTKSRKSVVVGTLAAVLAGVPVATA